MSSKSKTVIADLELLFIQAKLVQELRAIRIEPIIHGRKIQLAAVF